MLKRSVRAKRMVCIQLEKEVDFEEMFGDREQR
jgi:hypothetical protein